MTSIFSDISLRQQGARDALDSEYYNCPSRQPVISTNAIDSSPITPIVLPEHRIETLEEETNKHIQLDRITDAITAAAETVGALCDFPADELTQDIDSWIELHGFDEVNEETRSVVASQAVLTLYLKSVLYEWHHQRGDLPPLPSNRRKGIRDAKRQTNHPGFEEFVLDDIGWRAEETALEDVFQTRHQLLESTQPAEDIGRLYNALLSAERRQRLGQFRTPPIVGTLLRRWASGGTDSVLDPGIGAGVLSSPFRPRWDVSYDPACAVGIDRSPLGRLFSTVALTLYGQDHDVYRTDFLTVDPGDIDQVDAVISNPPYTNSGALVDEYKRTINRQIRQTAGIDLSQKAPLYAYFLIHATQFLPDGGRCAMLIPRAWLQTRYGDTLKQFLLDHYRVDAILRTGSHQIIDQADVRTDILLLRRCETAADRVDADVTFARLTESPQWIHDTLGFARLFSILAEPSSHHHPAITTVQRSQDELTVDTNWSQYLRAPPVYLTAIAPHLTATLQDLADISLGLTSGCNDFFYLSDAERAKWGLDDAHLEPLLKSPQDCGQYHLTNLECRRYVLHVTADKAALTGTPVGEYIADGESREIHTRSYFESSGASDWYKQTLCTAPLIHPTKTDTRHFVCHNDAGACVDKSFICIDPDDDRRRDFLFAYLNSTLAILTKELCWNTSLGSGVLDTTVGEFEKLPVIDPSQLTQNQRQSLQSAASAFRDRPIDSLTSELGASDPAAVSLDSVHPARRRLDAILFEDVLGLSASQQLQVYETVLRLVSDRRNTS